MSTSIEEKLLEQVARYAANRPASARLARYRELIAERRADGGYNDDDLEWADVQCQVATAALESGDIDGLLEAFDRMRNALIDAGAPKLIGHVNKVRSSRGGKVRAEKLKAMPAIPPWMIPVFDEAYELLDREAPARIGRGRLCLIARRVAGPGHPDHGRRDDLSERLAEKYLKQRSVGTQE